MANILIENVPESIVLEYGTKIEYSNKIIFPRHERKFNLMDEKILNDAIKSPEIRSKLKILASVM